MIISVHSYVSIYRRHDEWTVKAGIQSAAWCRFRIYHMDRYQCHECKGCPFKEKCIKGNNCKTPMEKREKRLYVSKVMKQKREENIKRITSEYGTQLRMNRSIQAEGSFANVKEDMNFRRYLYRGKENVTAQSVILAIGYNINKLHHKIQKGRTGQHLFALKK